MKLIWKYLRPYLRLAAIAPLCVLIEVWAELELPNRMSIIVDTGIIAGNSDIIIPTGIAMFVIMLIGIAGGLLSIYAAGRVSYRFGTAMREELYDRISRFSFADIDRLQTSSLIVRLSDDIMRVQQVVQASMRLLFRAPFLFVGAIVMVLLINVRVSVVILFIMVASFVYVIFIMRRTLPLFLRQQQRRDGFIRVVRELLVGVRVVKAYTNEDLERKKYASANEALSNEAVNVGRTMAPMMPVVSFAINIGIIIVIYLGAGQVEMGEMKLGGIMAAINYLAQIQIAIMMASHVIMNITQAQASLIRLRELLDTPTQESSDAQMFDGRKAVEYHDGDLAFDSVSFAYDGCGSSLQLADISFRLPKGSILSILGETGSGKSTLVNLIARFYDPRSGTVSIGGVDMRHIDREELNKKIGIVPQHSLLFAGTLAENLRMGSPSASNDDLMEACRKAQIADFVESHPKGLDMVVDQGGVNLSGGQKQRVCIARTLLTNPDILILDDSLCALDMITEREIVTELDKLDCTKVIVTQRVSSLRRNSQILLLKAGRVEAFGSHSRLMESSALYRDIYNSQMVS